MLVVIFKLSGIVLACKLGQIIHVSQPKWGRNRQRFQYKNLCGSYQFTLPEKTSKIRK